AQLSGFVYEDFSRAGTAATDNNCVFDRGVERPIAGVTVTLTDLNGNPVVDFNGNPVAATTTDANGFYQFTNLHSHVSYQVRETQPANYLDGCDTPGTTGGSVGANNGRGTDFITNIPLDAAATAQISGFVKCDDMPGEPGIAGVHISLVNETTGATTGPVTTDSNGFF